MKFNLETRPKIKKFEKQSQDYPEVINKRSRFPALMTMKSGLRVLRRNFEERLRKTIYAPTVHSRLLESVRILLMIARHWRRLRRFWVRNIEGSSSLFSFWILV
jgi:hypothetical protein